LEPRITMPHALVKTFLNALKREPHLKTILNRMILDFRSASE